MVNFAFEYELFSDVFFFFLQKSQFYDSIKETLKLNKTVMTMEKKLLVKNDFVNLFFS